METIERHQTQKIHWSSILSGSFVAVGVWLFLYALGAAIGGGGGPSAWTAVYVVVSPVIALFCGGLVAGRARGSEFTASAALHGIVVWGFTVSIGMIVLGLIGVTAIAMGPSATNVSAGYLWAVAGMLAASLGAAVLGAGMSSPHEREYRRDLTRREVHP